MARYGGEYPGFPSYEKLWERIEGQDIDARRRAVEKLWKDQDKMLAELKKTGKVISFGVADGGAYYFVKSEKPLVLLHIPHGDGYHISAAEMRGLRLSDIKSQLKWEKTLAELHGGK